MDWIIPTVIISIYIIGVNFKCRWIIFYCLIVKSELIVSKSAVKICFKMTRHYFDCLGVLFDGSVIISLFSHLKSLIMINFSFFLVFTVLLLRFHFNCRIKDIHKFMLFLKILGGLVVVSGHVEGSIYLKKWVGFRFQKVLII